MTNGGGGPVVICAVRPPVEVLPGSTPLCLPLPLLLTGADVRSTARSRGTVAAPPLTVDGTAVSVYCRAAWQCLKQKKKASLCFMLSCC